MDSENTTKILEISTVIENLSLKIATLQAKVDELCKSTGKCPQVTKVNKDLLPTKDTSHKKESEF
tara:strand:- start:206 stop:400 length:195 start_codon:yes stop_codon:yes gene_type:complete